MNQSHRVVVELDARENGHTQSLPRSERQRVTTLPPPEQPRTVEMDRVSLAAYELVALRADLAHVTRERDFYRKQLGQIQEFIGHMLTVGP